MKHYVLHNKIICLLYNKIKLTCSFRKLSLKGTGKRGFLAKIAQRKIIHAHSDVSETTLPGEITFRVHVSKKKTKGLFSCILKSFLRKTFTLSSNFVTLRMIN